MFRGFNHTEVLQRKLHLPEKYHRQLGNKLVVTADIELGCLLIYPMDIWREIVGKVSTLPDSVDAVRRLKSVFIDKSTEIAVGDNGLIELSEELAKHGDLFDGKAALLGQGNKIELWRSSVWNLMKDRWLEAAYDLDSIRNLDETLAQLLPNHNELEVPVRAFLSYSSEDVELAQQIDLDLRELGAHVWIDQRMILPGDSLYEVIPEGIESADFFLALLTNNSVESKWCKRELHRAFELESSKDRVFIVPILAEHCEIPPFLKEKSYADIRDEKYADGIEMIHARFSNIVRKVVLPKPEDILEELQNLSL